jgi:hypothetical protein
VKKEAHRSLFRREAASAAEEQLLTFALLDRGKTKVEV